MQISTVTAGQQVQAIAITERTIFRVENSMSGEFATLEPRKFSEWKIARAENLARYTSVNLESGKFTAFQSGKFPTRKIHGADNGEIEE